MERPDTRPDAKRLQAPAFPDDDGTAGSEVADALAAYTADPAAYPLVLGALSESRLLVPVVAVLGDVEYDEHGLAHDKTSDMATVLITGADGRQALLAFTSIETMAAWRPDARPVPVPTRDAARAALQEQAAAVVIDIAGPVTVAIEGQDLQALAKGWRLTRVGDQTAWIAPA